MFSAIDICKTYRPRGGVPVEALRGVTLRFGERGMVFILGKSGSGKSTLLHILGGLDDADAGYLEIDGKTTQAFSRKDFDDYRNEYVGFVFQSTTCCPLSRCAKISPSRWSCRERAPRRNRSPRRLQR